MQKNSRAQDPNSKKKIVSSKLTMLIGAFLLIFISVSLIKEIVRRYEINREIAKLEEEVAELDARNTELTDLIAFFNTDTFLEQEARSRLNLQKPGEKVVIIPDIESIPQEEQKNNLSLSLSNPKKWWNYFFEIK